LLGVMIARCARIGIPPILRTLYVGANMSQEVADGTAIIYSGVQAGGGTVSV